ncbi:MAG TPA: GNAT family protein [Candidatus Baltobacteraceae bacterium]|nr:GNAT family protein [Candidatus Baltobacteraceae bacterium]
MRVLLTERLRLVPVTTQNAAVLWQVLQQPGLREFQDLPDVDLAQFRRMVAARPARLEQGAWGRFEWLIFFEGVSEPVGWTSLRVGERATGSAEVGYSVVQSARGRGIATECVRAIAAEAFSRLHLRKLRAYCVPENRSSRAVLARAGFAEDGVLPRGATVQGQPVDVLGYVLDREQWEIRRSA